MYSIPVPSDEKERLRRLYCLRILDTPAEERFDRYTRMAQRLFQAPIALVSLVDADRQWFKARLGLAASETARDISFCGHAILDDDLLIVEDALSDPRFDQNPLVTGPPNIRFYAGCPIPAGQESALGTLCVIDTKPRKFSQADRRLLKDLGEMVAGELLASEMAVLDELTGLSSRRSFMALGTNALDDVRKKGIPLTLAYVDVDGFKTINDNLGHALGDQALKEVAAILRSAFRSSDIIGRIGGDEFGVLFVGADQPNAASAVEASRRLLLGRAWDENRPYKLSCSFGLVEYDSTRHGSFAKLLEDADMAMYRTRVDQGVLTSALAGMQDWQV